MSILSIIDRSSSLAVAYVDDMTTKWAEPQNSKGEVNRAGQALVGDLLSRIDRAAVLNTINNWRSSHSYPLQIAKMTLRKRAKKIDGQSIVAQRLKRLSSISVKLKRNRHMKLSQMQDIGGCRAVVSSIKKLHDLVAVFEKAIAKNPPIKAREKPRKTKPRSRSGWELTERYDYITQPKSDGYRSFHYVFQYQSVFKDKQVYNGLRIEIQLRTQLQHYWATAVEAVSTFTEQALKSGIGRPEWKRFFALMGSAIALRENCSLVPNTPTEESALVAEIRQLYRELQVETVLESITATVNMEREYGAQAYLLVLDTGTKTLEVKGYKSDELPAASQEYLLVEERYAENPSVQAVLVSVDSLATLESAYPNYYLDTKEFLNIVREIVAEPAAESGRVRL